MESNHAGGKMIAVAGGDGREATVLNHILRCCGRNKYFVGSLRDSPPEGAQPAVLLAAGPDGALRPRNFPVCVAEYVLSRRPEFFGHPHLVTYSTDRDAADFTARNVRLLPDGSASFEMVGVGIIGRVRLQTGCADAAGPAMAAAAAAIAAGVPFADVLKALNSMKKTDW